MNILWSMKLICALCLHKNLRYLVRLVFVDFILAFWDIVAHILYFLCLGYSTAARATCNLSINTSP